jgi:hypothetical protein
MSDAAASPAPAPTAPAAAPAEAQAPEVQPSWEEAKAKALGTEPAPKPAPKGAKKPDAKTVANGQAPAENGAVETSKPVPAREWASLHHKQGKLKEQQAAFEQKYEAGKKELAALEARAAELEQRGKQLESLEMDPKAFVSFFAKKLGCSEAKVINSLNTFFLEGRSPTDLELDKVKADLKRRDERDTEKEKAATEQAKKDAEGAKRAKVEGYQRTIAAFVTEHADDYVHLPTFPPEAVASSAWARIQEHWTKTGQTVPLDKMLATLEAEEERKFQARQERAEKRKLGSAEAQNPERGGAGQTADHGGQQRPSTLNHQLATQRGTKARELSDREAWEESKRNSGIR